MFHISHSTADIHELIQHLTRHADALSLRLRNYREMFKYVSSHLLILAVLERGGRSRWGKGACVCVT